MTDSSAIKEPSDTAGGHDSSAIGRTTKGAESTAGERLAAIRDALRAQQQADADGCVVIVSRQACDEAADLIDQILERQKQAAEFYDWVLSVCENPPEPTEKLKELFRTYGQHLAPVTPPDSPEGSPIADEPK